MSNKEDLTKKTDTKRLLIETVKELLKEDSEISIKEIATAASINTAAVNYHFGTKENLIAIATNEIIDELKQQIFIFSEYAEKKPDQALETFISELSIFTTNYKGLVKQLLIAQSNDSNYFAVFMNDQKFIGLITEKIAKLGGSDSIYDAYAKFYILATSICVPLLFDDVVTNNPFKFNNPEFLKCFLNQLYKILK
ncbi:MAG: TetR/AcrR family transcriptional regulator [Clostridia bacterium]